MRYCRKKTSAVGDIQNHKATGGRTQRANKARREITKDGTHASYAKSEKEKIGASHATCGIALDVHQVQIGKSADGVKTEISRGTMLIGTSKA